MSKEKTKLEKKWRVIIGEKGVRYQQHHSHPLAFGKLSLLINYIKPLAFKKQYVIEIKNRGSSDFIEKTFGAPEIQKLKQCETSKLAIDNEISNAYKLIDDFVVGGYDEFADLLTNISISTSNLILQLSELRHARIKTGKITFEEKEEIKEIEEIYSDLKIGQNEFLWGVKTQFARFIHGDLKTNWQDFNLIYDVFENRLSSSIYNAYIDNRNAILSDYAMLKKAYNLRLKYLLDYAIEQNKTRLERLQALEKKRNQPILKGAFDVEFIKMEAE